MDIGVGSLLLWTFLIWSIGSSPASGNSLGPSLKDEISHKISSLVHLNDHLKKKEVEGKRSFKYQQNEFLQCPREYQEWIEKGSLSIVVIFGYNDNEDGLTSDAYEKLNLMDMLSQSCGSQNFFACGFSARDDNRLTKKMDYRGRNIDINLLVENSSYSLVDRDNKEEFVAEQDEKSRHVELSFVRGLHSSDVVFYVGHSRDGGGPDFRPPRLLSSGRVDYPWYRGQRRGINIMLEALQSSLVQSQIIGLFSCLSNQHFRKRIHLVVPEARLILAENLSHFADFNQALIGALDAVLGMKCKEAFQKSLLVSNENNTLMGIHYW